MVKTAVVCGSETLCVTEMERRRLNTWEKILKWIYGPWTSVRTRNIVHKNQSETVGAIINT